MGGEKIPVLCIVGPTAAGKSDLGVLVATEVGGEVLSADSMQVYRGMDVGTAKLTEAERRGVPHHLLDLVDPGQRFTVADWVRLADERIRDIVARNHLPIVVGGTGLYIRAITEDLDFASHEGSDEVRAKWQAYARERGNDELHRELAARDPDTARRLHPNDVRRIIRALEVYELTRTRLSESYEWKVAGGRYETVQFGLTLPRDVLYERVNRRVDSMIANGLVDEVARLRKAGYGRDLTSMQAIGYKEIMAYLEGQVSLAAAVEQIKQATRRFAKRQLSWFRRDPRIQWIELGPDGRIPCAALASILATARQMLAGIRQ